MTWSSRRVGGLASAIKKATGMTSAPRQPFAAQIDGATGGMVRGWALLRDPDIRPAAISITFEGREPIACESNVFREDLLQAGYGNGRFAFQLDLPKAYEAGADSVSIVGHLPGGDTVMTTRSLTGPDHRTKARVVFIELSDLIVYVSAHRRFSGIQRVQCGFVLHLLGKVHPDLEYRLCCREAGDVKLRAVDESVLRRFLADAFDIERVPAGRWERTVEGFWDASPVAIACRDDDVLVSLGAPWALPDHNLVVRALKRRKKIRYLQLFYDLIPLTAPEYVHPPLVAAFADAVAGMVLDADHIFSISAFSRSELIQYCERHAIPAPPVTVVPLGATVVDSASAVGAVRQRSTSTSLPADLGEFVLCVGTIEPRKNHQLLVNLWKRMLQTRPRDTIPKLVLVGRIGWSVASLERELRLTRFLEGAVVHLPDVSDYELKELYEDCLFTVFPSLYEGWGLPIVESFNYGKVCVTSHTTSMPEAGGDDAIYIDPLDFVGSYAAITGLIDDRAALEERTRVLRSRYRPISWDDAAAELDRQIVAATCTDGPPQALAAPPIGGRLERDTLYDVRREEEYATADDAFAASIQRLALADAMGGDWYDPEDWGCWSCSPRPTLGFSIDSGGGDLACYLTLRLAHARDGDTVALFVDGVRQGVLAFDDTDDRHFALRIQGRGPDGASGLSHHTLVFELAPSNSVWRGVVNTQDDRRIIGLGFVSLYLCRDVPEDKVRYLEARLVGLADA